MLVEFVGVRQDDGQPVLGDAVFIDPATVRFARAGRPLPDGACVTVLDVVIADRQRSIGVLGGVAEVIRRLGITAGVSS